MSHRLRYTSSRSRDSSPRRDSSSRPPRVESASRTNHQHLTVPSAYQASDSRLRQAAYPPVDLTAEYLQTGYDLSNYSRPSSSDRLVNPRYTSATSTFGVSNSDPVDFHIDPTSLSFNVQPSISDPSLVAQADMSGYTYPSESLADNYRSGNIHGQYFTYSNPENPQRRSKSDFFFDLDTSSSSALSGVGMNGARLSGNGGDLTSSPSSYGASSNLGSTQYSRGGSVSSTPGSYLNGISSSPAAYNSLPYQPSYNVDHVNPQSVCNPSHAPALPGMLDSAQPGYRNRQPSSASVSSVSPERIKILETRAKPQCWEHGCNGRQFSTFSNLLRHQREKSGTATKSYCPRCNAEFTRTTARNGHMQHEKCKPRSTDDR